MQTLHIYPILLFIFSITSSFELRKENQLNSTEIGNLAYFQICPKKEWIPIEEPFPKNCSTSETLQIPIDMNIMLFVNTGAVPTYNINRMKLNLYNKCRVQLETEDFVPTIKMYNYYLQHNYVSLFATDRKLSKCYFVFSVDFERGTVQSKFNDGFMISNEFGLLKNCEFSSGFCQFGGYLYVWDKEPVAKVCSHKLESSKLNMV